MNLFVVLDALLDLRSVTKAGERLHIGASATSSALGRLRQHFNDEILVQVGRRLEPTPLALALREPVRAILQQSHTALATKATFRPAEARRRFVLNASDYSTTVLLVPLLRRLARSAPDVGVDIIEMGDDALTHLERGDVDIALYPVRNANIDYPVAPVLDDRYVCLVSRDTQIFRPDTISLDEFISARHVVAQFGKHRIPSFDAWFFDEHAIRRRIQTVASSFCTQPFLLLGTDHLATAHYRLASIYASAFPLRILEPTFEMPRFRLVMQWNHRNTNDPGHQWLRGEIIAAAKEAAPPHSHIAQDADRVA